MGKPSGPSDLSGPSDPSGPSGSSDPSSPGDFAIGTNVVVEPELLDGVGPGAPVSLTSDVHHHLARVLRLRPTDHITLTDGRGRWIEAFLGNRFATSGAVIATSDCRHAPEPANVGVAVALTKGDKPETVVQKLTELGMRRIVLVRAERSVVRWDDEKSERNRARLVAVARGALGQCRGAWLPEIEFVANVAALATQAGVVRADRGGRRVGVGDQLIAIGPEGGWAPFERELLSDAVGLPGSVLRAETAAIVAATVLAGLAR